MIYKSCNKWCNYNCHPLNCSNCYLFVADADKNSGKFIESSWKKLLEVTKSVTFKNLCIQQLDLKADQLIKQRHVNPKAWFMNNLCVCQQLVSIWTIKNCSSLIVIQGKKFHFQNLIWKVEEFKLRQSSWQLINCGQQQQVCEVTGHQDIITINLQVCKQSHKIKNIQSLWERICHVIN